MAFRCLWTTKVGPDRKQCREQCVTCAIYSKTGPMDFDSYLYEARKTAIYPRERMIESLSYLALGLASEAGEVASRIKKWIRDGDEFDERVAGELGDVLWYVAMLADELDLDLTEIAQRNLEKLRDRAERGQLQGSGDKR